MGAPTSRFVPSPRAGTMVSVRMDRAQYDRHGYAIIRGVLRDEEVAELAAAARALWAEGRRHPRTFRHGNVVFRVDADAALGPSLRFVQWAARLDPVCARWRVESRLLEIVRALLGPELKQIVARYMSQGGDAVFQSIVQMALDAKEKGKWNQTSYDPTTGNYNQFWLVDRELDNRTALIVDPPNGKIPPMTPEGQKRNADLAAQRKAMGATTDAIQNMSVGTRCIIMGGSGPPLMDAGYNANYQIVQAPGTVMILTEMIHDARIIPLDARPLPPSTVRQWIGFSRGRWEGETLVVEARMFSGPTIWLDLIFLPL